MKVYSTTDLVLIPELSHLRPVELIDPVHTELLRPYLKILGYDDQYPIVFQANQHRNLQGKVVIAFQVVGDVEINDSFLSSSFASGEDRIIAAGYRDLSISADMAATMTSCREYGSTGAHEEGFPSDQCEPNEKEILAQIKQLEDILLAVRGSPYRKDGSLATLDQHGQAENACKTRRKPVKKEVAKD